MVALEKREGATLVFATAVVVAVALNNDPAGADVDVVVDGFDPKNNPADVVDAEAAFSIICSI